MKMPEPSFSVNVDVKNPGQFFACCGLLELAHRLWPGAEGWFEDGKFCLARTDGQSVDFKTLLDAIIMCDVQPVPNSDPKIAPIRLSHPIGIHLDWWLKPDGKPNLFKTWAANATSQQMFSKWRDPLRNKLSAYTTAPEKTLTISAKKQGSYGFDSDLGWDALNVGFSLNKHAGLKELPTRPAVEIFGAIGLQRFFPVFKEKEQAVEYATWRIPLAAPVARVAVIGNLPVVTMHKLRTRFVYRGSFKGLDHSISIGGDI